jgi:hypothetical protein
MGLNTLKKQLWDNESLDNTTKATEWIDCSQLQAGSFSFVWSGGSSPVGAVQIFVSNEPTKADETDLTLSAALNVSGTAGAHIANIDDIPNRYIRLKYAGSSGTCNADVWFFGKGDGN